MLICLVWREYSAAGRTQSRTDRQTRTNRAGQSYLIWRKKEQDVYIYMRLNYCLVGHIWTSYTAGES